MTGIVKSIAATVGITYVVTFLVYAATSAITGLQPPAGASPAVFLVSVFVVKFGLAVGFVLLFALAQPTWERRWPLYAMIWWVTFAVTEVGQAIGPNYSWTDAGAGIVAEAISCPLAAAVTVVLLKPTARPLQWP